MRKLTLAIAGTLTITTAMTSCKSKSAIEYPVAPTDNTVDTYFDLTVADPYRPLEDDTAAVTKAWVEAENKVTQDYLAQIP